MEKIYEQVEKNIDALVEKGVGWSECAAAGQMQEAREGLQIRIEKGNMCDLSWFGDCSFDLILNPPSLMYVPDVRLVFKECSRLLKNNGIFIMMAPNPINYVCDFVNDESGA